MKKKVLSAAVISAIVAAQMAMPVMAEGGKLEVNTETIAPIIRVDVPTSMQIAVNQFEVGDEGSQIYSTPFTIENKSKLPVKVSVKSTATLKATTKLVKTKTEVATAPAGGAWLAVAAQTSATANSEYVDGSTAFKDLTETSKNVTTFVQGTGTAATAKQTFYLKQASEAYKLLNTGEDADDIEYAQFYELTAISLTGGSEQADLTAAIAESDIYSATVSDGAVVTKTTQGSSITYASGTTYYTVSSVPTAKSAINASKLYLYANGTKDAAAGSAGFRYMGKLSEAQDTWTKDDISKITIEYDIVGLGGTQYTAIAAETGFTYGRRLSAAPSISTTEYTVNPAANTEITVSLGSGDLGAKGVKSVIWEGEDLINEDEDAKFENGKLILDASVGKYLNDNNLLPATFTVIFDMNDSSEEAVEVEVTLKN